MLSVSLRRAQCQLRAHKTWLDTFAARSQVASTQYRSPHLATEYQARWSTRRYAYTVPKHIRKRQRQQNELEGQAQLHGKGPAERRLVDDLAQAITDVRIKDVIRIFDQITNYDRLARTASWRICQCLHEALRREKRTATSSFQREDLEDMVAFAETLVKHIKKGDLAPDCRAHLHLLAFYKESGVRDEGILFWRWLEMQDERYVNSDVYGAAIELLAVNGAPLTELEDMYQRALREFPGNFNEYHLSPNAIVPDREERTIIKGIPIVLLQSILTARLLRGASGDAYLALDTALRLYPTLTPGRFFHLFIEERPLAESYTVFAIACRAGILPHNESVRKLLTSIRTSSDLSSLDGHVVALRQMLSVAYMYVGAGGVVTSNLVSELVIAMTQILRVQGIAPMDSKHKKQVVDAVMDAIRKTLEIFARYGAKPGLSAFNSIIMNLAGFGQSKQIVGIALRDAQSLGLRPNNVTRRSILGAAGYIGDAEFVGKAWNDLEAAKAEDGQHPDTSDYHILVKAAKLGGAVDFAKEACKGMAGQLDETQRQGVYDRLYASDEAMTATGSESALDVSVALGPMIGLRADLAIIDERTQDRPAVQAFSEQALPITLLPIPDEQHLPEDELRIFYDELTTEQANAHANQQATSSPAAVSDQDRIASPAVSETNIPLGRLRYENWKVINYLLGLAEKHDRAYDEAVDEAIASGVAPPHKEKVLKIKAGIEVASAGLSDVRAGETTADTDEHLDVAQIRNAREKILSLRGLPAVNSRV